MEGIETTYKVSEVAAMFKVRQETVRNWIKEGKLTATRTPGNQIRIPESSVKALGNEKYGE